MESINKSELGSREYSPQELMSVLWSGRWIIFFVTTLFAAGAGTAALVLPKKYESLIVIAPVSTSAGSGQLGALGSLASQFGGLASLTGLSAGGDPKKSESIAVLQSGALTERFIETNNLLPVLYSDKWDPQKMRWRNDNPKKIPTLWKANQFFKKSIRTVTTETKTGLVTMSIAWKDPIDAAKWANELVRMTNDYLRGQAIAESERNIAYLNQEALKTDAVELRQAIYTLMESEINKAMLARGSEQFAFRIIDPAAPPEKPYSPLLLNWLFGGVFIGLFTSVAAVLVHSSWKLARGPHKA